MNLKEMLEARNDLISDAGKWKEKFDSEKRDATEDDVKLMNDYQEKRAKLDRAISVAQAAEKATYVEPKKEEPKLEERKVETGKQDVTHKTEELKEERKVDNGPSEEQRSRAFRAWFTRGSMASQPLSDEDIAACKACRLNLGSPEMDFRLHGQKYNAIHKEYCGDYGQRSYGKHMRSAVESRALSNLNLAAGGALVPEGFINELEIALLAYGGMREVSKVIRTDMGNPLPMPTVNDTTNKATLIAENTTVSEKDIVFGQITFSAYKFTSGMVQVPVELMQDSAFNLESYVGELLGIRMARGLNDFYTTGTGASQPNGIITAIGSNTVAAASGTSLAMDDIINLVHGVDPLYRPGGTFMCHDSMKQTIRKLKDGMGRYMWSDGDVKAGIPEMLWGYPVVTNQSMQSVVSGISSGNKTILFGEMKKFVIREVATVRLLVLRERFADSDQIGFVAFLRADSNLVDAGTHPVKVLKH